MTNRSPCRELQHRDSDGTQWACQVFELTSSAATREGKCPQTRGCGSARGREARYRRRESAERTVTRARSVLEPDVARSRPWRVWPLSAGVSGSATPEPAIS